MAGTISTTTTALSREYKSRMTFIWTGNRHWSSKSVPDERSIGIVRICRHWIADIALHQPLLGSTHHSSPPDASSASWRFTAESTFWLLCQCLVRGMLCVVSESDASLCSPSVWRKSVSCFVGKGGGRVCSTWIAQKNHLHRSYLQTIEQPQQNTSLHAGCLYT